MYNLYTHSIAKLVTFVLQEWASKNYRALSSGRENIFHKKSFDSAPIIDNDWSLEKGGLFYIIFEQNSRNLSSKSIHSPPKETQHLV